MNMSQENANRSVPPLLIVAALCVPLLAVSLYIALRPDVELPNANAPQQRTLRDSTVQADEQGNAEATFTGTRGTVDDVHILVGSPLATEQVQFIVHVLPLSPK